MNAQFEKFPRWGWKLAWLLVILGLVLLFSRSLYQHLPSWESASSEEPTEYTKCHFSKGETRLEVNLEPDKWSCWVTTPSGTNYRFEPDDYTKEYKVKFWDGTVWTDQAGTQDASWFGIKRGIFKFKSNEAMTIIVTIEQQ